MIVLDASAVLALRNEEPGAELVVDALSNDPVIALANLAEVLAKLTDAGLDPGRERTALARLGIEAVAADPSDAVRSAELRAIDTRDGRPTLSLGDRLCLAVAQRLDAPVLTADGAWAEIDAGIDVRRLR